MNISKCAFLMLMLLTPAAIIAQNIESDTATVETELMDAYDSIISKATMFFSRQEFDQATEYYKQASYLKPGNTYPYKMMIAVESSKKAYEKVVQKDQDLKRKAEINRLLDRGLTAIMEKNYDTARSIYTTVLSLKPVKTIEEFTRKKIATIDIAMGKKPSSDEALLLNSSPSVTLTPESVASREKNLLITPVDLLMDKAVKAIVDKDYLNARLMFNEILTSKSTKVQKDFAATKIAAIDVLLTQSNTGSKRAEPIVMQPVKQPVAKEKENAIVKSASNNPTQNPSVNPANTANKNAPVIKVPVTVAKDTIPTVKEEIANKVPASKETATKGNEQAASISSNTLAVPKGNEQPASNSSNTTAIPKGSEQTASLSPNTVPKGSAIKLIDIGAPEPIASKPVVVVKDSVPVKELAKNNVSAAKDTTAKSTEQNPPSTGGTALIRRPSPNVIDIGQPTQPITSPVSVAKDTVATAKTSTSPAANSGLETAAKIKEPASIPIASKEQKTSIPGKTGVDVETPKRALKTDSVAISASRQPTTNPATAALEQQKYEENLQRRIDIDNLIKEALRVSKEEKWTEALLLYQQAMTLQPTKAEEDFLKRKIAGVNLSIEKGEKKLAQKETAVAPPPVVKAAKNKPVDNNPAKSSTNGSGNTGRLSASLEKAPPVSTAGEVSTAVAEPPTDAATAEAKKQSAEISKRILSESPQLNLFDRSNDVKMTCQSITTNGKNIFIKVLVQNLSPITDFAIGNLQLIYIRNYGNLARLSASYLTDFTTVAPMKEVSIVYVTQIPGAVEPDEVFIFEMEDKLKMKKWAVNLPAQLYIAKKI